jgi:putative phosphonate metabolism protein
MNRPSRYALYYAPPTTHPLWGAGCEWLQRDPTGAAAPPPHHKPSRPHVREPWRYGFHATLKPPMRLAEGRDEASLLEAIERLAQRTPRFEMPALSVQWLSGFLALRPAEPLSRRHPLHRLADDCVAQLDPWRAPPSPEETQRRQKLQLDDEQRDLLQRYGYPHVMGRWRFHMTLTDSLPADVALRATLQREVERHFKAALAHALACDALCLFVEAAPGEPFTLTQRFALASG